MFLKKVSSQENPKKVKDQKHQTDPIVQINQNLKTIPLKRC